MPLITQIYLREIYPSNNLSLLLYVTILFIILFIFKLFLDIWSNKFINKYLVKLEKHIKEINFQELLNVRKISVNKAKKSLETHPKRYILFVKNFILYNYNNLITMVSVFFIMFFFSFELFKYSFWFLLIFIVYLLFFNIIINKNKKKIKTNFKKNVSYLSLIEEMRKKKTDNNKPYFIKQFNMISSLELEKEINNKNSLVFLNQTIRASITFFRVLFLAYFGYLIIVYNQPLSNLIVGLLYITIFGRSIINILNSFIFYIVTKSAIIKVHKNYNINKVKG